MASLLLTPPPCDRLGPSLFRGSMLSQIVRHPLITTPSRGASSPLHLRAEAARAEHVAVETQTALASVTIPGQQLTMSPRVPLLSLSEALQKLQENVHARARKTYKAMYSSLLSGIVTDPALMVLPMDDHMVHRGHAVFDTAIIWDGYLYDAESHLDRIISSSGKAKIALPLAREEMLSILLQISAVSKIRYGSLRYWISAGPGSFTISPAHCISSVFYAVALEEEDIGPSSEYDEGSFGITAVTCSVPIKPPEFATMKSTNYLPNALAVVEALKKGKDTGIWLDVEGFIAEGPVMNVAFVNNDKKLLIPQFDRVLRSCTCLRAMDLAKQLVTGRPDSLLCGIEVRRITLQEAKAAPEMFLMSSGVGVEPVLEWDNVPVGNGKAGPVALALKKLLEKEMSSSLDPKLRIKIPEM
eukprot:TRINITY_DN1016_c0_g1_i3.p1 TRINITY_DN1016_c0_g1~~TRINITY_DN1016_c0_g1_i3.p1  ORF type:complete len:429 (-),score=78.95 TRINITY_DN1016_c0_g1_i3:366-1607(-)